MKLLLGIALLAAVATVALWERGSIGRLRVANESLRAEKLEADRLANENQELSRLRSTVAAATTNESGRPSAELLRLRAEVSRLRAQPQEAATLRAENERIAAEIKSGKFAPKRLADMEGFIPREQWADAGFATPEAAVQSFFAAIMSGDVGLLLRCGTPEVVEQWRQQFEQNPERFRSDFQKSMVQLFGKAAGFRVTERSDASDTRITLSIQFAANGKRLPLELRRVGNEWKVHSFP